MNVSRFDMPAKTLSGRVIDHQSPIAAQSWIELLHNEFQYWQHERSGMLADRLQQFIKAIPIVGDSGTAKQTGSGPATIGKHGSGDDDGQAKGDPLIEHAAHGSDQHGNPTDQRHGGGRGAATRRIASVQPLAFVVLGWLRLGRMLRLWYSSVAFILSHPWPSGSWCGVVTSNFHEGLFRDKINFAL